MNESCYILSIQSYSENAFFPSCGNCNFHLKQLNICIHDMYLIYIEQLHMHIYDMYILYLYLVDKHAQFINYVLIHHVNLRILMKLAMSPLFFSHKVLKNITCENKFYVVIIVHTYYILTVLEEMHIYSMQSFYYNY